MFPNIGSFPALLPNSFLPPREKRSRRLFSFPCVSPFFPKRKEEEKERRKKSGAAVGTGTVAFSDFKAFLRMLVWMVSACSQHPSKSKLEGQVNTDPPSLEVLCGQEDRKNKLEIVAEELR